MRVLYHVGFLLLALTASVRGAGAGDPRLDPDSKDIANLTKRAIPSDPFGGSSLPRYSDVKQDAENNCWVLATMMSAALRDTKYLRSLFTYKNNNWAIHLPDAPGLLGDRMDVDTCSDIPIHMGMRRPTVSYQRTKWWPDALMSAWERYYSSKFNVGVVLNNVDSPPYAFQMLYGTKPLVLEGANLGTVKVLQMLNNHKRPTVIGIRHGGKIITAHDGTRLGNAHAYVLDTLVSNDLTLIDPNHSQRKLVFDFERVLPHIQQITQLAHDAPTRVRHRRSASCARPKGVNGSGKGVSRSGKGVKASGKGVKTSGTKPKGTKPKTTKPKTKSKTKPKTKSKGSKSKGATKSKP